MPGKPLEFKEIVTEAVGTWIMFAPLTKEAKVTIFWNGQVFIFTPTELTIAKEDV